MNAVEIEEAVSTLVEAPFDPAAFPFAFLEAFGNKEATIKRLRAGTTNQSDVPGAVLQRSNIHIMACPEGQVSAALATLRASPATAKHKAKFILATDGKELHAENLIDDIPPLACEYRQLPDHFGFFLPLAGITTVRQISENAFDIRATGRLNRLYVELRKHNPDWDDRREDLNHFFARLIFCFFAEDTGIFDRPPTWSSNPNFGLFSWAIETMTEPSGANCHEVLSEFFLAMNTPRTERGKSDLTATACRFPYVNGNLFSGSVEVPKFSKIARSYLLFIGGLDWKLINPDIFGSMIQAVAEDEERGALGMHYTSVPNILKVLNPLFLDDLKQKLAEAGDGSTPASKGQLKRLRDRLARIRVFDPACGSGNFLVIAYKEMRGIEAEINRRRGEPEAASVIPMTNFRGIELRHFAAEIARLALIIAKFQCDALHIGDLFARRQMLPLEKENWITCGNALRLDWLQICPPTGTGVKIAGDDLYNTPLDQSEIDFENAGGETYICGNPPYAGATVKAPKGTSKEAREKLARESERRKSDLKAIFDGRTSTWGSLDYVSGWFMKAVDYGCHTPTVSAFVSTNSVCQGQQVPTLWPLIFSTGHQIAFAHTSFKWENLAAHNAGVTVVIIGLAIRLPAKRRLYATDKAGETSVKDVDHINAYLVPAKDVIVEKRSQPPAGLATIVKGNAPTDGGHLLLDRDEVERLGISEAQRHRVVRRFLGSEDSIDGTERFCLWMNKDDADQLSSVAAVASRLDAVSRMRLESDKDATRALAKKPYLFGEERQEGTERPIVIPRHSSESREYLPFAIGSVGDIVADSASAMYDAPMWNVAVFASRLHLIWIATVCGKIKTDYRYSNTLGWNTFPVPPLSDQNKADLTRCAEEILLAREAHFPATIADLYDPEQMPADLRAAHDRNDETLERIYIGRRFKNDTERLEVLFDLYTKMVAKQTPGKGSRKAGKK